MTRHPERSEGHPTRSEGHPEPPPEGSAPNEATGPAPAKPRDRPRREGLRSRSEWGTFLWEPHRYGRSHLGLPLEVWRPSGRCRLLVFAGLHGEEPETTYTLSRALRQLAARSASCAVVLAANPDGLIRGTRANARGVDLNRNFPARNWRPDPVTHRSTNEDPSDIRLSPGTAPASEPETRALIALIEDLRPEQVIALHAPLACIDDAGQTPLARRLSERTGMPLVPDVGYPTPGSFGSWGLDRGLPVITYEFPVAATEVLMREHVPVLVEVLTAEIGDRGSEVGRPNTDLRSRS